MMFFFIYRLPPVPTLTDTRFPSPTLFRSRRAEGGRRRGRRGGVADAARRRLQQADGQRRRRHEERRAPLGRGDHRGLLLGAVRQQGRSAEHTSELQSLMRISYAVFCLKKNKVFEPKNVRRKRPVPNT